MLVNTVDLEIVIFIAVREAAAGFDLIHSCLILSLNKHGSLPCQKNITWHLTSQTEQGVGN